MRCVVYIDLNMVRAGLVKHPRQWTSGGYHEIQVPPRRYRIVDRTALVEVLGVESVSLLAKAHETWIEAALAESTRARVPEWSESVAVGGRDFVERVGTQLAGAHSASSAD